MRPALMVLLLASAAALLPGCVVLGVRPGLVVTRIVEPLDTDMNATQAHLDSHPGRGSVKHFEYSYVELFWGSNGVADVMRAHEMKQGDYADLETFSVMGVWNQYTVRVYGKDAHPRTVVLDD